MYRIQYAKHRKEYAKECKKLVIRIYFSFLISTKTNLMITMEVQSVGERIELLCERLDISRRKFAEKIEENPSTIASIVRGSSPSANIICSILMAFPELSERWLLMGEEPMWKADFKVIPESTDATELENLRQQLDHKNETILALKGQVTALEKMVELLEKQLQLLESQHDINKKAS